MNSQMAEKAVVHNRDQKKTTPGHSMADHGVHVRGKLLPRQKHAPLNGSALQPNGDPDEVMLWGDM